MILFKTSHGDFSVELFPKEAPISVANFLQYVDDEFFDGTIFHRVVPGFVIQTGALDTRGTPLRSRQQALVRNLAPEFNATKHERGALSMARTNDVNSATSQFFVNLKDNEFLDHKPGSYGYAVFGRVSQRMDVIDKIAATRTGRRKGFDDAPMEDVVIVSARRADAA